MKVLVDIWPPHDCGRECKQYGKIDPRKRRGRFLLFEIMGHALIPFRAVEHARLASQEELKIDIRKGNTSLLPTNARHE